MNKNIYYGIIILVVLIIVCLLKSVTNSTASIQCRHDGCPDNDSNPLYKLYTEYESLRRKNNTLTSQIYTHIVGPANIFIIRHGEKVKTLSNLDCNGVLRSTYIPKLIEKINDDGYGIHTLLTAFDYNSMHQEQTIELSSWLLNIPLFMYGHSSQTEKIIKELFTNPYYNGKTVLICWEHRCIQQIVKNIIEYGTRARGLTNYTFKNPNGTSELPYWDKNNYSSIFHFDEQLNFAVFNENIETCAEKDKPLITFGRPQQCGNNTQN